MTVACAPQSKLRQFTSMANERLSIQSVILAGGPGTNRWPLSCEQYPKRLLQLVAGESLLATTARRLDGLEGLWPLSPFLRLVCGEIHSQVSAGQLVACGKPARIILEPSAHDSPPALPVAALEAVAEDNDAVLVVMPANHVVPDAHAFQGAVSRAALYAADGATIAIGVMPRHAEPRYGYIRVGMPFGSRGGFVIDRFVEKPHRALAAKYVRFGEYRWNCGIFVVRASIWRSVIHKLHPSIHAAREAAYDNRSSNGKLEHLASKDFDPSPDKSIDYGVMERLGECKGTFGVVVPMDSSSSDVGSSDAVWLTMSKDPLGNVARGRAVFERTVNSFAHSQGRLVACVSLKDVLVVETADAIPVADEQHAQQIKRVTYSRRARFGSGSTSQGPSAVGFLRFAGRGGTLPSEAYLREAGRKPVLANASSPRGALDRRSRHRAGHVRTEDLFAERGPVDLYSARHSPSTEQPRKDAARDHRGAVGCVSGRRQHHPIRGQLWTHAFLTLILYAGHCSL